MTHDQTYQPTLRTITDEICAKYFDLSSAKPAPDKISQAVRRKCLKNEKLAAEGKPVEYIWQDDLKTRIKAAVAVSVDMDEFSRELAQRGVGMAMAVFEEISPSSIGVGFISIQPTLC